MLWGCGPSAKLNMVAAAAQRVQNHYVERIAVFGAGGWNEPKAQGKGHSFRPAPARPTEIVRYRGRNRISIASLSASQSRTAGIVGAVQIVRQLDWFSHSKCLAREVRSKKPHRAASCGLSLGVDYRELLLPNIVHRAVHRPNGELIEIEQQRACEKVLVVEVQNGGASRDF